MSISSSAHKPKGAAATASQEGAVIAPITLSERSSTGLALLRILVGYLWFQQLFWKLPPTFAGLYGYVVRESQHAILPGYGALLQHTFLASCSSLSSPVGCTVFVPLAACVWTAELLVSISLLFGLFTRFGAILATVLSVQLYVDLDLRHAGAARARLCRRSSGAPARGRSLAGAPPRGGRTPPSVGAHRELVCVARGRARPCIPYAGDFWRGFWPVWCWLYLSMISGTNFQFDSGQWFPFRIATII